MKILDWQDVVEYKGKEREKVSVTMGVFDGLHLGHQQLIRGARENELNWPSLVISFRNNPLELFLGDKFDGNINTLEQKLRNFELNSIDILVLIDFSLEFSKITGKDFWSFLLKRFDIKKIVVGEDFRFGKNREGTADMLKEFVPGANVVKVPIVSDDRDMVRSTVIRELIRSGNFRRVNQYLYTPFTIDLTQMPFNEGMFRISDSGAVSQVLPSEGIYRVLVKETEEDASVEVNKEGIRFVEPVNIDLKEIKEIQFIE